MHKVDNSKTMSPLTLRENTMDNLNSERSKMLLLGEGPEDEEFADLANQGQIVGQVETETRRIKSFIEDPSQLLTTPYDYYHQVSYCVDLKHLYKRMGTCYYNDEHEYIPVFMEYTVTEMIDANKGCQFLIQIWNKNKDIHFQQPLSKPIKCWQSCSDCTLYTLQDDKTIFLYMIDYNSQKLIKLRNLALTPDKMVYFTKNDYFLTIATEQQIYIYPYQQFTENKNYQRGDVDCANFNYQVIDTQQKILGLFTQTTYDNDFWGQNVIIVIFESKEFKLDFNLLDLDYYPAEGQKTYLNKFRQLADIHPRDPRFTDYTSIRKVCYKVIEKKVFAITLSESGKADLYCNMIHKQYIYHTVYDAEMSMLSFFLKLEKEDDDEHDHYQEQQDKKVEQKLKKQLSIEQKKKYEMKQEMKNKLEHSLEKQDYKYVLIKHKGDENISYECKEDILDDTFSLNLVQDKILQDYVDIFQSFVVKEEDQTMICLIAHGKFISAYDLLNGQYLSKVLTLPDQIETMFYTNYYEDQYSYYPERKLCVMLKNSDIYIDIMKHFNSTEKIQFKKEPNQRGITWESFDDFKYTGTLTFDDPSIDQQPWFLVYNDQEIKCMHRGKVVHKVIIPQASITSIARYYQISDVSNNNNNSTTTEHLLVINCNGTHILYALKKTTDSGKSNENVLIKKKYLYEDEFQDYSSDQSKYIINYSSHPNTYISLCGSKIRVNNVQDQSKNKEYQGYIVASFRFITQNVNYALCKETHDSEQFGLLMIDFNKILNEEKVGVTLLNDNDIGVDPLLTNFAEQQRLGFINSVNSFIMVPYLHSDKMVLMGKASAASDKLLDVQVGQFNVVLNQKNELISWTLYNGKLYERIKISKQLIDFQSFNHCYNNQKDLCLMYKNVNSSINNQDELVKSYFPPSLMEQREALQQTRTQQNVLGLADYVAVRISDFDQIEYRKFEFPQMKQFQVYFNNNFDIMICQLDSERVIVYKTEQIDENDSHRIKLIPVRVFTDYPSYLQYEQQSVKDPYPHFISPDFKYYLRYLKQTSQFCINDMITGRILHYIDENILQSQDQQQSKQIANKFIWLNGNQFKVMHYTGTEIVYEYNEQLNTLKDIKFNVWPLFTERFIQNVYENDVPFYIETFDTLDDESLIKNLKYRYQRYKSDYYLNKYNSSIDKNQMIYKLNGDYVTQSFTYLHWSLVQDLLYEYITINDLSDYQLEGLIYNIFPKGKTFLHELFEQIPLIKQIYARCHSAEDGIIYHIPFLPDFDSQTLFSNVYAGGVESTDRRSVFNILQYLKLYGIDHHSRCIQDYYDEIISTNTQIALDYLESRFIQTQELEDFTLGIVKDNKKLISTPVLHKEQRSRYQVGKPKDYKMIKIELLDIPAVYHYLNPNFKKIFTQLSTLETYDFFNNKAIQALIDLNYPIVRNAILWRLILPFFLFHVIFVCYTNIIYEKRFIEDYYEEANITLGAIILGFSFYILLNEIRQVWYTRLNYFQSFWNYIDILAPSGVIIQQSFQFAEFEGHEINPELNRVVLALSTLLMWTKFLSIFRVFDSTNYLIRTVYEVIYDMGIFLFVLLITVAGFGDSFLRLSEGNDDDNKFIESFIPAVAYAYSMILGGYDTEAFGEVAQPLVWIFWVLCTIVDMIVMLNLLIAIISATFERVNENQKGASYQEKACIIAENGYLIPKKFRAIYAQKDRFILSVEDIEKVNSVVDETEKRFNDLTEIVTNVKTMVKENNKLLLEREKQRDKKQEEVNSQILKRIGEIKLQMLKQAQGKKEEIHVTCHAEKLTKMLLAEVQEEDPDQYQFWNCAAKRFVGCKRKQLDNGNMTEKQLEEARLKEVIYHCSICYFDFCTECYKEYPNTHKHKLVEITFEELQKQEPAYSGWNCDGTYLEQCERGDDIDNGDIYEAFYHGKEHQFDLCIDCGQKYQDDEGDEPDDSDEDSDDESDKSANNNDNEKSKHEEILSDAEEEGNNIKHH